DDRQVGEGFDLHANMFFGGFVTVAVADFVEQGEGADAFEVQLALAGVEFGDFNEVCHEVVKFFRFAAGGGNQLGLERLEGAAEALSQRVEAAPQLEKRTTQLAAGHGDELGL